MSRLGLEIAAIPGRAPCSSVRSAPRATVAESNDFHDEWERHQTAPRVALTGRLRRLWACGIMVRLVLAGRRARCPPVATRTSAASPVPTSVGVDGPGRARTSTRSAPASASEREAFFPSDDFVHHACDSGGCGTTFARRAWRGASTPCKRTSG